MQQSSISAPQLLSGADRPQARWRLAPSPRRWAACAVFAAAAAALWLLLARDYPAYTPPRLHWWMLAGVFFATERWPQTVNVRRGTPSMGMSVAPLLLGLFFATPVDLLAGYVLGASLAAATHPRSVLRAVFDLAEFLALAAVAEVVFHALASSGTLLARSSWMAGIAAAGVLVAGNFVTIVLFSPPDERQAWPETRRQALYIVTGAAASTSLGLIAVALIGFDPPALALLALLGCALLLAYRAFVREHQERLALEFLHLAGDALGSRELESAIVQLLQKARTMFSAEMAQLSIFPSSPGERAFRTTVRTGAPDQVMEAVELRHLDDVLEAETDGVIVDRNKSGPATSEMLARRGIGEAMVALLRGESRLLGSLLVGGHTDARSFDARDLQLFQTLAVQTSTTLENGRLERSIARLTELQEQLTHQAFHDSLTGLANRTLFGDRIEQALARSIRAGRVVAVLFIDIDDFKGVNDTFGHAAGDGLLIGVAERVRGSLRRPDTAARLGGDEFALLLEELDDPAEAEIVARRIFETLRVPFDINGQAVNVRVSIGVAVADVSGDNASNLMRHADVAMYSAKGAGKDRYVLFAPGMETDIVSRHKLRGALEQALANDQFLVHYQPIVDLISGDIVGIEALVRWRHPARGLVGPVEFIPMAEESGLILALGDFVLRTACANLLRLQARYPRADPLTVSVNISARQLQQPLFVENVLSTVEQCGLLPHAVTLELTESILLEDAASSVIKLEALQRAGIRIAIDDFGTGYSSLSYLRRLPVDILKIAKPFVDDLAAAQPNGDFARAIVGLGSALRLSMVAEGIETIDQVKQLRELGCTLGQGYLLSHPVSLDEIEVLLQRGGIQAARLDPEETEIEQVIPLPHRPRNSRTA